MRIVENKKNPVAENSINSLNSIITCQTNGLRNCLALSFVHLLLLPICGCDYARRDHNMMPPTTADVGGSGKKEKRNKNITNYENTQKYTVPLFNSISSIFMLKFKTNHRYAMAIARLVNFSFPAQKGGERGLIKVMWKINKGKRIRTAS